MVVATPRSVAAVSEWTDYYEIRALASDDRNSSIQEVLVAVKQSGTLEAAPGPADDQGPEGGC